MRKIIALLFICYQTNGQVPQGLNYQAVARTSDGTLMPTQNITARFSIIDININGTVLYSETHKTTTNNYGLFTLTIGRGTPQLSTFSKINWSSGTDKFLKVEISPANDSNYQLQGTTQLLSVPFALYAERTNLVAGNNTIKIIRGNTITSNLQAGLGIRIKGNIVSHNLLAGKGINISGNVITNTGTNQWIGDASGIHNQRGHVGIGVNAVKGSALTVSQENTGGYSGAMDIYSGDDYHTVTRFRNTTVNQEYQFSLAGSTNNDQTPGSFGVFHATTNGWLWHSNGTTDYVGIGSYTYKPPLPKSRLHVFNGDVNIDQIGSGIILKSPNGSCWRVTIDNTGNLVRRAITCPD